VLLLSDFAVSPDSARAESIMNHSMHTNDRRTHLKIVVVGLLCAVVVTCVGIFAHNTDIDLGTEPLVKAKQSTVISGQLPIFR